MRQWEINVAENRTTDHPERGDLDKMTQKPQSVQRELEEARRLVSRVVIPPSPEDQHGQ
jgi:hypothetical protein